MKPSERIAELRMQLARKAFGIPENASPDGKKRGEFVTYHTVRQAELAAKDNPHIAAEAIIQFLDEESEKIKKNA